MSESPILYSFRRCPYAMRARIAIGYSQLTVEVREIDLRNKPKQLLQASPKATVPVLIYSDNKVIDESLEIIYWALNKNDPLNWLQNLNNYEIKNLITQNDEQFKINLDHYKYSDRFPEHPAEYYRQQGESFLQQLEHRLSQQSFLLNNTISIADIAIFPFIRQFAYVDIKWFESSPYPNLRTWLNNWLKSDYFLSIMQKNVCWSSSNHNQKLPVYV